MESVGIWDIWHLSNWIKSLYHFISSTPSHLLQPQNRSPENMLGDHCNSSCCWFLTKRCLSHLCAGLYIMWVGWMQRNCTVTHRITEEYRISKYRYIRISNNQSAQNYRGICSGMRYSALKKLSHVLPGGDQHPWRKGVWDAEKRKKNCEALCRIVYGCVGPGYGASPEASYSEMDLDPRKTGSGEPVHMLTFVAIPANVMNIHTVALVGIPFFSTENGFT